jgi:hypothetical protein
MGTGSRKENASNRAAIDKLSEFSSPVTAFMSAFCILARFAAKGVGGG